MMVQYDLKELGQRLRRYRIAANLTQAECASRSGVSLTTYQRIETSGRAYTFDLHNIFLTLGVPNEMANLLHDDAIPRPRTEKEVMKLYRSKRSRVRIRHSKKEDQ